MCQKRIDVNLINPFDFEKLKGKKMAERELGSNSNFQSIDQTSKASKKKSDVSSASKEKSDDKDKPKVVVKNEEIMMLKSASKVDSFDTNFGRV